jgi:hypothetical protein
VQHTSHTITTIHFILQSAMVPPDHPSIYSLSDILMLSIHSRTMTQSTRTNYTLQSAVPQN